MAYQLFAGKFAEEYTTINKEQAKNTADYLTYRIPSLLSVKTPEGKERIISLFDFSQSGGDFGRIQVKERYSDDGGKTFSEMQTVLSLAVQKTPQTGKDFLSAFAIDPILVQCENGDVLIIVDMYPECKGLMFPPMLNKGSGYVKANGKNYLALYKQKTKVSSAFSRLRKPYTVRENGVVYSSDEKPTNYYVKQNLSADIAFEDAGDLYYKDGDKDIYCGNIYLSYKKPKLSSGKPKEAKRRVVGPDKTGELYSKYACVETSPAPLSATVDCYLWMLRSKDGGLTWEQPVDITADLMRDDEMFLGTGPGVATRLSNGRILVPLYNTKETCVAYSDDNGYTWHRSDSSLNIDETQLIQTKNGDVLCFGRKRRLGGVPFSISKDNGETWEKLPDTPLCSIKCQKSVIAVPDSHYLETMDKNSTYVLASTPTGHYGKNSERFGGAVSIGKVEKDNTITWLKSKKYTAENIKGDKQNFFAYSCLTALENGNFAILYEGLPSGLGVYEEFSLDDMFSGEDAITV